MKKLKILLLISLLVILCSYLFVEINTVAHKDEFSGLYTQATELADFSDNYCKVFYKNDYHAKVFYATDTSTFMCYFYKESIYGEWVLNQCDVLWSKTGSASDLSYPFYPVKDIKSYFA